MRVKSLLFFITSLMPVWLNGQSPVASFNAPASACLNETLSIQNTSAAATQYIWDLCLEDLKAVPVGSLQSTLATGSFYHSTRILFDAGEWIGFVTDLSSNNRLLRLDFGSALTNTPSVTDLGTLSGFGSPGSFELVNHNGTWYAFVLNLFGNSVVRITFGNGLKQPPTLSENLGNVDGALSTPSGIRILTNGSQYWATIVNLSSNVLRVFDFGNSPANTPVLVSSVGPTGFTDSYGIAVIRQSGNWYALVGSFSASKTTLLNFGSALTNVPVVSEITGIPQGADLEFAQEGGSFYAVARSRNDGLYRIDFGTSLPGTPLVTRLGQLGLMTSEARHVALVRDSPLWRAFSLESSTGRLVRADFSGNCAANVSTNFSTSENPIGVFYKNPGTYSIELTAKNAAGLLSTASQSISISNQTASGVSIQNSNVQCMGSSIEFSATSSVMLTSLNWNFGDGNVGTGAVINHTYVTDGQYTITVEAIEQSGCRNSATTSVSVFDLPVVNFSLPTVTGTICTLQDYTFNNTTIVDGVTPVTWTWQVDGTTVSASQNLVQSFATINTYNITLHAALPGCSNAMTKMFSVAASGPEVNFSFTGHCLGYPTQFTNATVGAVTNYSWNFGDGQTSTLASPSYQFVSASSFGVTLQATNAEGCSNSSSQQVIIANTPQPNFYIDLPPFSCSGNPTQFHDATPALPDGNVVYWSWDFNDGTGSTSSQQNPTYTYAQVGNYLVSLQVESNFGCSATTQIPIEIAESPAVDFTLGAACLNKGTPFIGASPDPITSWNWTIGNTFYGFPEPTHTFNQAGTYNARLIATAINGCEGMIEKNIVINPVPQLDFSTSLACEDQSIVFTDQTIGTDSPQDWTWNFGSGVFVSGSPASHEFQTSGAKPVQMTVTTQAGCEYSITKNVIVSPSPVASFTTSTSFGPPPLQVQFTNNSLNSSQQSWKFGFNNQTSNANNPTFVYSELGDYLVELTATNGAGCSDVASQTINVLVPIYNIALEDFVVYEGLSGNSKIPVLTVKNSSNVTIHAMDVWVTGSSGLRVKSDLSFNLQPGDVEELILPLEIFTSEKFLCVELAPLSDVDFSDNSRCLNFMDNAVLITPYPNPTAGLFWLEVVMANENSGSLKIMDNMGKTVFYETFANLQPGMNRVEIDFTNHPQGLYIAIWEVDGKQVEFRFIRN